MNDHLPECPGPAPCDRWDICDRLRACEARVREEYADDRYGPAYRGALQEARDAVAALEFWATNPEKISRPHALAAIDALRGES